MLMQETRKQEKTGVDTAHGAHRRRHGGVGPGGRLQARRLRPRTRGRARGPAGRHPGGGGRAQRGAGARGPLLAGRQGPKTRPTCDDSPRSDPLSTLTQYTVYGFTVCVHTTTQTALKLYAVVYALEDGVVHAWVGQILLNCDVFKR